MVIRSPREPRGLLRFNEQSTAMTRGIRVLDGILRTISLPKSDGRIRQGNPTESQFRSLDCPGENGPGSTCPKRPSSDRVRMQKMMNSFPYRYTPSRRVRQTWLLKHRFASLCFPRYRLREV